MSIESVMPSNYLILCHLLFLLPSTFPNIRVFSNESVLHIRWPKYWSFDGYEFEQASGVGDGQGGLVCYGSWGRKELDTTEQLN